MTLEKIDKFYQDFDTFFALVFHDQALSAIVMDRTMIGIFGGFALVQFFDTILVSKEIRIKIGGDISSVGINVTVLEHENGGQVGL